MTTTIRRDRTGEPVETDDRTPADVAALGAAACRAALAASRARRHRQETPT